MSEAANDAGAVKTTPSSSETVEPRDLRVVAVRLQRDGDARAIEVVRDGRHARAKRSDVGEEPIVVDRRARIDRVARELLRLRIQRGCLAPPSPVSATTGRSLGPVAAASAWAKDPRGAPARPSSRRGCGRAFRRLRARLGQRNGAQLRRGGKDDTREEPRPRVRTGGDCKAKFARSSPNTSAPEFPCRRVSAREGQLDPSNRDSPPPIQPGRARRRRPR